MTHKEKREILIKELLTELPQYREMQIPTNENEQKSNRWLCGWGGAAHRHYSAGSRKRRTFYAGVWHTAHRGCM